MAPAWPTKPKAEQSSLRGYLCIVYTPYVTYGGSHDLLVPAELLRGPLQRSPVLLHSGSNNFPLRGSKVSDFEGGVRAVAFLAGGYLPMAVRGTVHTGLIAVADCEYV